MANKPAKSTKPQQKNQQQSQINPTPQPIMVKLDDEQLKDMMEYLDRRMDNYSDRIARSGYSMPWDNKPGDAASKVFRWVMTILFVGFGSLLFLGLISKFGWVFAAPLNLARILATVMVSIIGIASIKIGIDIKKETDRQYLVSLFSALVAMAALVVALVSLNK